MDQKLAKSKRIGNHYIPPPARKQGNGLNETTRQKERTVKSSENKSVKLCNDSSLLFKESNNKDKVNPRRSRRSKRTDNKDAENAAIHCENEVAEPKTSSTASKLIDQITNCHPDTGSDVSVLVGGSAITPGLPLIGLENMSRCQPVFCDAMDGSSLQDDDDDDDDRFKLIKLTPAKHKILKGYEELEKQLKSMILNVQSYRKPELPTKDGNEYVEPGHTTIQHDILYVTAKVDDQLTTSSNLCLSNVRAHDIPREESLTTFGSPSIEASADEPQYRSPEMQTYSESSGEPITIANSNCENDESSASRRAECSKKINLVVSTEPIQWTETEINSQVNNIEDGDWESIYNDQGECLIPPANRNSLPSSKNAPNVKAVNKKVDDEEERPHDSSSTIEIYGFSEDLKTCDIMAAFGNWVQRGFTLKWVDNTHALGILSTPALAEEVLGSSIPFVKVRPISQGTPLSQAKARNLILPSSLRPKTCPALARRLVSSALGLRVNVTPEERAAERELLREAREKKKLVLKQRYAAWEGDFSSLDNSEDKASN